jgi:hypothetical protein
MGLGPWITELPIVLICMVAGGRIELPTYGL